MPDRRPEGPTPPAVDPVDVVAHDSLVPLVPDRLGLRLFVERENPSLLTAANARRPTAALNAAFSLGADDERAERFELLCLLIGLQEAAQAIRVEKGRSPEAICDQPPDAFGDAWEPQAVDVPAPTPRDEISAYLHGTRNRALALAEAREIPALRVRA